jgi:hypothetical protein
MEDTIGQYFTGIEAEKRKAINSLMKLWLTSLGEKDDIHEYTEFFSPDGFFPGYYKQKPKVLFIGREPRWTTVLIANNDSIASILHQNNNKASFWKRILYMVQLFKSDGNMTFEQIKASDYANKVAETGDYGFAFMNISKYSNDLEEGGRADWDCINTFLEYSQLEKRNYFQEELKLLDPDYIITANLWGGRIESKYLDLCFGKLTPVEKYPKDSPKGRWLFEMDLGGKKIKLIDLYHFSRPGSDKDHFYSPIKELLFSDKK